MMIPRTRKSRFFLFLLHLVGEPQLRPNLPLLLLQWNSTGIQSVHPSSIALEVSDLYYYQQQQQQQQQEGSSAITTTATVAFDDSIPHWIQDASDQQCLGPMGSWGECGDATLWRIIPTYRRHARRRQWIRWATEDEDVEEDSKQHQQQQQFHHEPGQAAYALQLVDDVDADLWRGKNGSTTNTAAANFSEKQCLSRRRKDNKLVVVSCQEDRSWFWKVNENGILHFDRPIRGMRMRSDSNNSRKQGTAATKKRLLHNKRPTTLECLWRNGTDAMLHPCDGQNLSQQQHQQQEHATTHPLHSLLGNAVQIQFVRSVHVRDTPTTVESTEPAKSKFGRINSWRQRNAPAEQHSRLPPSLVDRAHIQASPATGGDPTELRSASRMTSILPHQSPDAVAKELPRFLGRSTPILVISDPWKKRSAEGTGSNKVRTSLNREEQQQHQSPSSLRRDSSSPPEKPMIRKIQMNPYIAASQDELWTDPQTGLVFRTDLCHYLGHDRKDAGRHTLVGHGQYTKTMLQIKVYGVGFYVSKRDILADPSVEAFAGLSSEELRTPQFYDILRTMDGYKNTNNPAGKFDRTLFLKTNMQLATETMRSSLDADWKMLTPEAKELLIGSSMKAMPATEETLRIIESPDNPSRCSCAQIAPEEYNADPSCCARGTELVFTWRKNGNLEIRLNGNFVDSFPRPDIAEGIFFEYLRTDEPMSTEFLANVVEGFPFMLAPLSQVKGIASPVLSQSTPDLGTIPASNSLFRTIGGMGEVLTSQAVSFADLLHSGAHEFSSSAVEKAKSVGSAAKNLGEELERKRELIGKHIVSFSDRAMSNFYNSDDKKVAVTFDWISDSELSRISSQLHNQRSQERKEETSRFTRMMCWAFGADAASLTASDVTQRLFFSFVHVYLLLLLIATFPTQWRTYTKVVPSKRSSPPSSSHVVSESDNSDSDDSFERRNTTPRTPASEKVLFVL